MGTHDVIANHITVYFGDGDDAHGNDKDEDEDDNSDYADGDDVTAILAPPIAGLSAEQLSEVRLVLRHYINFQQRQQVRDGLSRILGGLQ